MSNNTPHTTSNTSQSTSRHTYQHVYHSATLIYPHQLFLNHPTLAHDRIVYLIEDPLFFSQYKFHKQKLVLHRASMKAYAAMLKEQDYTVVYVDCKDVDYHIFSQYKEVHVVDVVDDWLQKKITKHITHVQWYESPQFLTSASDIQSYWQTHTRHIQHDFYVWQRKRLQVLVQDNKPEGGAWSFDADNRKRLPKDIVVPAMISYTKSDAVLEAIEYVEKEFPHHYGTTEAFSYATTHTEAKQALEYFLQQKFATFGPYEDAITTSDRVLFHSVLSPYLNNGLLTPQHVLDRVLVYAEKHTVPIASLEGFVRQLIGWREFMRMVYVCDGVRMRNQNALKAHRTLTKNWWTGDTGIYPIDHAIATLTTHAYTHHIVRLMVVGNIMTLLGVQPKEAYHWFMEWYIDAYDWVMVPNVYGMALYADGGSIVTKPYISSSKYLTKMSDYPKGEWETCWDALYWHFIDTHQSLLVGIYRASLMVCMYTAFTAEKKKILRDTAERYLQKLCK